MTTYSEEFKLQAVKKALSRNENQSMKMIADELNIASSTLWKWIKKAKSHELTETNPMSNEKSPQDWTSAERFEALMATENLNDKQLSIYCRKEGIYPHHLKQWKTDFISNPPKNGAPGNTGQLKKEIRDLTKELQRKEKALAETAALLVLSKKCQAFWNEKKDV